MMWTVLAICDMVLLRMWTGAIQRKAHIYKGEVMMWPDIAISLATNYYLVVSRNVR